MKRFSIITISYNAEAVIARTLESVLSQTYEKVEHLIIDGASTDKTLSIVEDYKRRSDASGIGHKVIIQSEPDHGIYDAMNKGLTQALGDYVLYMNAGDFFPSADTLEQIARSCKLNDLPFEQLSPSSTAARTPHVALVPAWHAGLSSGILCPYRYCQEPAIQHRISLFCRCRLVHSCDARRRAGRTPSI